MKKYPFATSFIIIAIIVAVPLIIFSQTETASRFAKSIKSNFDGGLERTVTLYDYNGNVIDEWEGKLDVQEDETRVFFDLDDKRVVIYNGIVVTEEK